MTEPRKRNPAWRDNTRAARQRKRQAVLNQAAQDAGFESWSQLETTVVNGATVTVTEKEAQGEQAMSIYQFTESNVTVRTYSPRASGETENHSEWKEIEYSQFLTLTPRQRAEFVRMLATQHNQVWLRTAAYGRARIFVK